MWTRNWREHVWKHLASYTTIDLYKYYNLQLSNNYNILVVMVPSLPHFSPISPNFHANFISYFENIFALGISFSHKICEGERDTWKEQDSYFTAIGFYFLVRKILNNYTYFFNIILIVFFRNKQNDQLFI